MSVNPINLSIRLGDRTQDDTIRVTPRNNSFRSLSPTNSCMKTRIASLTPPVSMKPNNKFRQWADPPPPPLRSRTAERKHSSSGKRRTGSVDSRFRRTLSDISDKKKTFEELKTEFICSSRTLKTLNENSKETETDDSCLVNTPEKLISISEVDTRKSDFQSIYHTLEPPVGKYKVNNELEKVPVFDFNEDSLSDIFNNHKTAGCNQLKSKPCINVETILEKEPETEIIFGRIADNFSQTDISIASRVKYDDKSSSEFFGLKEDDSYISDVYSKDSQETIETEANFRCKTCSDKDKLKNNRYLRYLEVWSTILTLSTFGALTWVYVVPYLQEYVAYLYYTHINPKPEPPASIFNCFYQLYDFIEDVLSTPSHTRIKYFK